jgi:hypothetical protein
MREIRVYRLHRCRNGQPWVQVIWPDRSGREWDRWLVRPTRPPYPWDWDGGDAQSRRLGEMLLLHAIGSLRLAITLGESFGVELSAMVPHSGGLVHLGKIYGWFAGLDKTHLDDLMKPSSRVYEGWSGQQMLDGPLAPRTWSLG